MGQYSFTERAPHEAGFSEVFGQRIVPILERAEKTRAEAKRTALRNMGVAGAVGAGGAGAGFATDYTTGGIIAGVVGALGAGGSYAVAAGGWTSKLSQEIVPVLCDFLGGMRPASPTIPVGRLEEIGVVPSHDNARLEDAVEGSHRGIDWAMAEARLTRRSRDSKGRTKTTTVFRGLLFRIAVHNPAPRIYFARDRGSMLNWLSESLSGARSGLEKIEIDNPEFERIYEVYTDQPEAARAFIGPQIVEGLMMIAAAEAKGGYVACAFDHDSFFLALPRSGDFLSLGSLFRPTHTIEEDLHQALADLDLPRKLIDAVAGG